MTIKKGNLWLFGAGGMANRFLNDAEYRPKIQKLKGIIDNNYEKYGKEIEGITIYSYTEFLRKIEQSCDRIIITCSNTTYIDEIVYQLAQDRLQELILGIYQGEDIIKYESRYNIAVYSQFGEELGLLNIFNKLFGKEYKGFYVDVGAYHPFILSNTKWAYDRGWTGINIEPNEKNFALFQVFRPRDININCGISDEDGIEPYYRYTDEVCNSFDNLLDRKLKLEKISNIQVKKLNDILNEYDVRHIDFLNIDAEGFDERIVKSFDWDTYKPICVLVEILSKEKSHFWTLDIHNTLISHGYHFFSLFVKTLIYVRMDTV